MSASPPAAADPGHPIPAGPEPLRIGPYGIPNRLVLAPMAGVTDRPFRRLCRGLGAGLAFSEMVSAKAVLHGNRRTLRRLDHQGEPGPIAVQILGADPGQMAEAARVNVGLGADIIDINLGCPAKKVCRVAAGSALLRDEPLVGRLLAAVVAAVEVPVTLKMRTGWSPQERNGVRIARIAEESGVQALSVHGRTRACGYGGQAEYDTIRAIKAQVAIPVIANGDIDGPHKAGFVLDYTGADAIMVGRAAQGRPWIFPEIAQYLAGGEVPPPPTAQQMADLVIHHLQELYAFYGEFLGIRVARNHIAWYSRRRSGAPEFRALAYRTSSVAEQLDLVARLFGIITITTKEEPRHEQPSHTERSDPGMDRTHHGEDPRRARATARERAPGRPHLSRAARRP